MEGISNKISDASLEDPYNFESLQEENRMLKERLKQLESSIPYAALDDGRANIDIRFEELEIDSQIGGGGYSLVYRAMYKGTPVAVKRWFDPDLTDELLQEFREEVLTLKDLRHPNVVQFIGACMRPPNLCIVLEFLPHSLFTVLHGGQFDVDRKRALSIAIDVCRAFQYLHSRRPPVIHRDIKPANFLIDRSWKVKLCDFGLASNSQQQKGAGTPAYMAPELQSGKSYNEKVDVYAFGILLWELIAKKVPFDGLSTVDIKQRVVEGERPEMPLSCPRTLATFIKECWSQDSSKRPSFMECQARLKTLSSEM